MKSTQHILSLDLGTTGVRAILYTPSGRVSGTAYSSFKQYYPQPGWVEHDPEEIYAAVLRMIAKACRQARCKPSQIAAIGVTNQRETVVVWDRQTGRPLYKAIVWQDRRTESICAGLKKKSLESLIRSKTGLVLDPYFSATKINWILKHVPQSKKWIQQNRLLAGTIDTWVIWKLTGKHVTDLTNASRTLLLNIHTRRWDSQLLKIFNIPQSILPEVLPSGAQFGLTQGVPVLADGIPIQAVLGDQQAALYGQNCVQKGDVKNTYGTGCFMVMNAGVQKPKSVKGLLTTLAVDLRGNPVYAFEGSIFIAGAVVQWLRDELKMVKTAEETEKLARSVPDTHGMIIVPAFAGLGSPYWRADLRGAVSGLTRGVSRAHFVRAALESIAQQSADVLDSMRKVCRAPIRELKTDGKAALNSFLMQYQADLTGLRIFASEQSEITAWGAARLAGEKIGFWKKGFQASKALKYRKFKPKWTSAQRNRARQTWLNEINFLLSR